MIFGTSSIKSLTGLRLSVLQRIRDPKMKALQTPFIRRQKKFTILKKLKEQIFHNYI